MRYFLLASALFLLASCNAVTTSTPTTGNSGTQTSTSGFVKSPTGAVEYDPSLQKTIPSPTYGTGTHELTIYADFQCPACIVFSEQLEPVFDAYAASGKLLITYKQFPLTTIHKNAYRDALAGLCAAEQGKYKEFKKTMYSLEKQKAGATVTDADRIELARANGLDVAAMTQCLKDNRYASQVDADIQSGETKGVNGTPTIFLDGTRLDIRTVFSDMNKGQAFLDRVLAQ